MKAPSAVVHGSALGTFETSHDVRSVVAIGGKADVPQRRLQAPFALWPAGYRRPAKS